jgi:hypothetical protein
VFDAHVHQVLCAGVRLELRALFAMSLLHAFALPASDVREYRVRCVDSEACGAQIPRHVVGLSVLPGARSVLLALAPRPQRCARTHVCAHGVLRDTRARRPSANADGDLDKSESTKRLVSSSTGEVRVRHTRWRACECWCTRTQSLAATPSTVDDSEDGAVAVGADLVLLLEIAPARTSPHALARPLAASARVVRASAGDDNDDNDDAPPLSPSSHGSKTGNGGGLFSFMRGKAGKKEKK